MTRRPDDPPESWHDTYDDAPAPHGAWIGGLFLGAVAVWLALEFYDWFWRV